MTTWTTITNAQIDQDSPVTQTLMTGLRDNVAATAEGSTNAPVMVSGWHPNDMVNVGDGNDGKVYDFAVDGGITALEITMAAGFEYRVVFKDLTHDQASLTRSLLVDAYKDTAATYVNLFTSTDFNNNTFTADGWFQVYNPRLTVSTFFVMDKVIRWNSVDTGQSNVDVTDTDFVSKIRIRFSADRTWTSGVVYVYRRQFFV